MPWLPKAPGSSRTGPPRAGRWTTLPPPNEAWRSNGRAASPIDGVKVLVVDDDLRNIFAMTTLLERGRADVIVVESGADAIATLERTPDIDIVLLDIMMPVMDGYETVRAIRAIGRFKSLAIIAVTGKAMAGERQRCFDAGANNYVPKPVEHSAELLAALRPWLPATRARANGPASDRSLVQQRSAAPKARHTGFEESGIAGEGALVDDDYRNIFAMTALLERGRADIVVAESGAKPSPRSGRRPTSTSS